ncbi:uncharacterized protein LOC126845363 [Adelges cooleyi]|uniref:uncharacterized protein LOC126845363 n=1 Tax=Adelges cooleyi TaxID=133065 RepID=UPI00218060BA|nr:uncharacterized protein LOC126845363 [Adelges cooleyi]
MHGPTSVSTLAVWVAVLGCCTSVVSGMMSKSQKTQAANKLNSLVGHLGWDAMEEVKILINKRGDVAGPVSTIRQAVRSEQRAVNETNVLKRHKQIWTVLTCKYGEIMFNYKCLVNHYIGVCQSEERESLESFRRYYDCVDSLLLRLHNLAPSFKCMWDALMYIYSVAPQPSSTQKRSVMDATRILAEYTGSVRPTTLVKFTQRGHRTASGVDHEMTTIGERISQVYDDHVQSFIHHQCEVLPANRKWTANTLVEQFEQAINAQLIPQDTTMLQYVQNEMDTYVDESMGKWFYNLGFTYTRDGVITIGTNY